MPFHVQDVAWVFQQWWQSRVDIVTLTAEALVSSSTALQYWWPFVVWLTSMKALIENHRIEYTQMYDIFGNNAHALLMMQPGLVAGTDVRLTPDTTRMAIDLIDCHINTGVFPSEHHLGDLQKCILREVRWKANMLLASQLVPEFAALKFHIEDLMNLRATCTLFRLALAEVVGLIHVLLHQEWPWAVFTNACPSIPKLRLHAMTKLWP